MNLETQQDVRESLIKIISKINEYNYTQIPDNHQLIDNLELDSMQIMELVAYIREELKISITGNELKYNTSFGDLVKLICKKAKVTIEDSKKYTKYWCHYSCGHNQGGQNQIATVGFVYETEGEFGTVDIDKSKQMAKEILNIQLGVKSENVESAILTFFGKLED